MDHKIFFKAVVDMRHFQLAHEREPTSQNLALRNLFETQVDTEIERVFKILGVDKAEELTIDKMNKK